MNDDNGDQGDAFAIPDLWAPSRFLRDSPDSSLLFSQLRLVGGLVHVLKRGALLTDNIKTSTKLYQKS